MAESDAAGEPIAVGRCPWCSSPLDDVNVATCPHCGAALREQVDGDLPGVTQIDALALATQKRERGKGVRALIGLSDEETQGSPARSVPEPPSDAVRREMLRLRIGALDAQIEARAAAVAAAKAEAAARGGPSAEAAPAADASAAGGDTVEGDTDGGDSDGGDSTADESMPGPGDQADDEESASGTSA